MQLLYHGENMKLLTTAKYHEELEVRLKESYEFSFNEDRKEITAIFSTDHLEFSYDIETTEEICKKIIQSDEYSALPFQEARVKYAEILGDKREAVSNNLRDNKKIIEIIKNKINFCLNSKLSGEILKDIAHYYVIDNHRYRVYPDLNVSSNLDLSFNLTNDVLSKMTSYFTESKVPLLAFTILENSNQQNNLRQRWIGITIAAELGIKEFFVRTFPELEIMLNEMPSPNIRKMYGPLLEHYTGEKAPNLTSIQKGIEVRNSLIHNFTEKELNAKMLDKYSKEIKECLIFLQEKLTGSDSFTKNHVTFGELTPSGVYESKINLTEEQKLFILNGNCNGVFKTIIY